MSFSFSFFFGTNISIFSHFDRPGALPHIALVGNPCEICSNAFIIQLIWRNTNFGNTQHQSHWIWAFLSCSMKQLLIKFLLMNMLCETRSPFKIWRLNTLSSYDFSVPKHVCIIFIYSCTLEIFNWAIMCW